MKDKIFSIIICGFNEQKNLDTCIISCLNQTYPKNKYEIIYIDNNSQDNSLNIAKKYPIRVFIEKKQGLSEARNLGIKKSKGNILIFLDADTRLNKNYLKKHEKTFNNKKVVAGGGKVLPLIKTWVSNYLGVSLFEGYPRYKKRKFIRTYPGCNLTIRREILNKIGGFKENLKTSKGITRFSEDKEICERIRKKGYKILYNPNPIIYHKNIYEFKNLIKLFFKGSKARLDMIKLGKKDPFSLLFKFHFPTLFLTILFIMIWLSPDIFLILLIIGALPFLALSIKSYYENGLFFESIFIKPYMDLLSIIIIDLGTIFYKFRK